MFNVIQKNEQFFSTSIIGVDFTTLYNALHDRNIKVNIWDTSCKTRFHSIIRTHLEEIFTSFISKIVINNQDDYCSGIKILNESSTHTSSSSASASSPTLITALLQNRKPTKSRIVVIFFSYSHLKKT